VGGSKLKANSANGKRTLAIVATLVLVVSFGLPVVASVMAHPVAAMPSTSANAAVTPPTTAAVAAHYPTSPHPFELQVYDVAPGGATSEDPAVAYDTVSYEPIMNVFQTLVTSNGTSTTGYIPVLATCVPGTPQCNTDYPGTNSLITNNQYWTFVIDPKAQFYDPATSAHWGVYPTDVMFSIARDSAYSEAIGVGNTAGWLIAQTLLPNGNPSWDGGLHAPYNTTPNDILGSMLINDSTYCPASAMTAAHGCITFDVNGGGGPWPTFLDMIGDGFMSVLPCGWYTYMGAGLPGWGTPAANATAGDDSCALPNGATTTQGTSWTNYLSHVDPTSWDAFEENLASTYPAPAPAIQWDQVGSGPYYSIDTPTGSPPGYSLIANPDYAQPIGCPGLDGLAAYGGYCDPAADSSSCLASTAGATCAYVPTVSISYESSDAQGIFEYKAHQADLAAILPTDTSELLTLASEGYLHWFTYPTLSIFFQMPNLDYSPSAYASNGLPTGVNIPADFFSGAAARALMTHAFPYVTAEDTGSIIDGVVYDFDGGGPIATGMNDYPSNVSYPYLEGNPTQPATVVGSAAWWWHVGTTIGSGYYDPELAACLNATCKFPVIGENGATNLDIYISELIPSIETITNDHVQPYTFDLNFGGPPPSLIAYQLGGEGPGSASLPYWNLGWAADNPTPEDYFIPLAYPDSTYTYGDAVNEQFNLPTYNNPTLCGHSGPTLNNLIYWAKQPAINSACEGVAYDIVSSWFYNSTHSLNTSLVTVADWAIQAVLNSLNLYTWDGQENEVVSAAPWINLGTINTNPMFGGGGDNFWFHVGFVPYETPVTFTAKGLPSGATFNVTAGSPGATNTSAGGTTVGFFEPNGTLPYSFTPPAGYAAISVSGGPKGTTTTGSSVSGSAKGLSLTVTFAATQTVTFTPTGLPSGAAWGVSVTFAKSADPPNGLASDASFSATSTGTTPITFTLAKGSWKFVVTVPTNYKVNSPKGSVGVGMAPISKTLKFTLVTGKVAVSESGLAKGTTWSFSIAGAVNDTVVCTFTGTTAKFVCPLVSGTYTVTVTAVTGYTTGPYTTTITVVAPKGVTEKVTFTKT